MAKKEVRMDKKQIKEIARDTIREQYPEMVNVEPEIEMVDTGIGNSSFKKAGIFPRPGKKIWVATFKKEEITEDGFPMERITRITLDESGKVIKLSESK